MSSPRIPVLHFSNSFVRGGAEEHILTLLRHLDRNYFRLLLVCPAQCAETLRIDLPADVQLIPLSLQKPYAIPSAIQFARILHEENIGILHSHLFGSSLAASPIGRIAGVPVIIETPHIREAWRHGLLKGHFAVDRLIGRFVNHYIAVSASNAKYLIEEKGLPAKKIHVIQNGCDLKKFDLGSPASDDIRQSLGFAIDDPVLLVMGRLEPQKGHRYLLQAHAQVLREFPTTRLVCVGEGSLRRDLEEQSKCLNTHASVRFVGFQSNVSDWLRMANISVLPSLYEGLPLVAIESLAARRPMVATAVDGTMEVVVDGKTGMTVPPADAPKLAAAILYLLRQPELGHALAAAGRDWVVKHFSQEQQVRRTQELYLHARELKLSPIARRTLTRASVNEKNDGMSLADLVSRSEIR